MGRLFFDKKKGAWINGHILGARGGFCSLNFCLAFLLHAEKNGWLVSLGTKRQPQEYIPGFLILIPKKRKEIWKRKEREGDSN